MSAGYIPQCRTVLAYSTGPADAVLFGQKTLQKAYGEWSGLPESNQPYYLDGNIIATMKPANY